MAEGAVVRTGWASGAFVAAMGGRARVVRRGRRPEAPRVNFDECSVELHKGVRDPEPGAPGRPARGDYEYERNGTANLFVVDPSAGRRYATVTERRTKADFARQMRVLCDDLYPDADRVRVVLGELNTRAHGRGTRRAAELEFHYTPEHASWLNMAELELSVLARRCLSRRIPDAVTLAAQVEAGQDARNRDRVRIEWCFEVADARKKMARVYPPQTPAADHWALSGESVSGASLRR